MPNLVVRSSDVAGLLGRRWTLVDAQAYVLGRAVDPWRRHRRYERLLLPSDAVGRCHALIEHADGRWWLADLNASMGVWVLDADADKPVRLHAPHAFDHHTAVPFSPQAWGPRGAWALRHADRFVIGWTILEWLDDS
jgi:hypothetical protein